jgi:hypothetical protein
VVGEFDLEVGGFDLEVVGEFDVGVVGGIEL